MSLEEQLSGWTGPSSDSKKEEQEGTERMIRQAVDARRNLSSLQFRVPNEATESDTS